MVGQWFPKVGVLDVDEKAGTQAWHCEPFHRSSEFYADFGTYDVTLTVPETHVVAATGVLVSAAAAGPGLRALTWRAEDVHDFAWMADPRMRVATAVADGDVEVRLYHRPEQARFAARHLEAARRTIETFGRLFYRYPWPIMTVIDPPAEAAGSVGGMEYPTLVTTAGDSAWVDLGPRVYIPELVTVHEVGHNWFQGILASNEVDEAWLDEGLNEYADGIVLDEWKGAGRSVIDGWGLHAGHYPLRQAIVDARELAAPIAIRSYEFPDVGEYATATYEKTTLALKTLEETVGRDRFRAALGAYARRFAFRHPRKEDLFAALGEALGEDASWLLRPAFEGRGDVDLRVREVRTRKAHAARGVFGEGEGKRTVGEKEAPDTDEWVSEVLVVNVGHVPAVVDVELRLEGGARVRERWDTRERAWRWFELRRKDRVVGVTIDPDHRVWLEHERVKNELRTQRDWGAAWRAGARAGFWEQTLLQVVGL